MDASHVLHTIGIFPFMNDYKAQDAVLHNIFSSIQVHVRDVVPIEEVVMTLFRLYTQNWEPARTYFYKFTGKLLDNDNDDECIIVRLHNNKEIELNRRTISGDCDRLCKYMNSLWFMDYAESSSESSSSSSRSNSNTCSSSGSTEASNVSGEGSMEYLDDSQSVESVDATDESSLRTIMTPLLSSHFAMMRRSPRCFSTHRPTMESPPPSPHPSRITEQNEESREGLPTKTKKSKKSKKSNHIKELASQQNESESWETE